MIKQCWGSFLLLVAILFTTLPARAGNVTGLITFTAGTPAKASEVNGNFTAVKTAVDDSQAQIDALKTQIAILQADLGNLLVINKYLSLQTMNGYPTVRVTGANLQIVNGERSNTTNIANGTGNLIIGYDEARTVDPAECSVGYNVSNNTPVTNEPSCVAAGGTWAVSHKSGSHHLVIGQYHNYTGAYGMVVGMHNTTNFDYANVIGGNLNSASGPLANVTGGLDNTASGYASSVGGGNGNTASGGGSSVAGGSGGTASGANASICGGAVNTASGDFSSVSGGKLVNTSAQDAWAAGGTGAGTYHSP